MNGLKIQWVTKGLDGIDTSNNSKNYIDFPIAFSNTNYVTSLDQFWISTIGGTKATKATNKITFSFDTKTIKFSSIIAIGY